MIRLNTEGITNLTADETYYLDIDPEDIVTHMERTTVTWGNLVPGVYSYRHYSRAEDVNSMRRGMWYIDKRGNVFVRCLYCGKLFGFDRRGIHPAGIARPHRNRHNILADVCHTCPSCRMPIHLHFKGWEECQKNGKSTAPSPTSTP